MSQPKAIVRVILLGRGTINMLPTHRQGESPTDSPSRSSNLLVRRRRVYDAWRRFADRPAVANSSWRRLRRCEVGYSASASWSACRAS